MKQQRVLINPRRIKKQVEVVRQNYFNDEQDEDEDDDVDDVDDEERDERQEVHDDTIKSRNQNDDLLVTGKKQPNSAKKPKIAKFDSRRTIPMRLATGDTYKFDSNAE